MQRRNARGESVDDGKVGCLEYIHAVWVVRLGLTWEALTTERTSEMGVRIVEEAMGMLAVTDEVACFVRDMDCWGVGFGGEQWDEEARM